MKDAKPWVIDLLRRIEMATQDEVVVVWWEGIGKESASWQYRDTRRPFPEGDQPTQFTPTPALIAVLELMSPDVWNNFGKIWVIAGKEFDFLMSQVVTAE